MKKYIFTDKQGVPHVIVAKSITDAAIEIKHIDDYGFVRFNMISKLIESEETAIAEYELALNSADNDEDRASFSHILTEEREHLKMLKAMLNLKEV